MVKKRQKRSSEGKGQGQHKGRDSKPKIPKPRRRKANPAGAKRFFRDLFLASLSGCLVFLCFPRYDLYPLLWVALIPMLVVIEGRGSWSAFRWGCWTGLITNVGGFHWITGMLMDFGHFNVWIAGFLCGLLCLYQGLVIALWAGGIRWLQHRSTVSLLWIAPLVWVVVEYLIPLVFPWYLANGQYLFYPAIQICEVTGVMGLSFLLVLVNTGLYMGLKRALAGQRREALRPVALVLALFVANTVYGWVRIQQVDAMMAESPHLKIGLGEANVGIFEKEAKHLTTANERLAMLRGNILKHNLLAAALEKEHQVDLIVEPESSFIPAWPLERVRFKRNELFAVTAGQQGAVLTRRDRIDGFRWEGPTPVAGKSATIHALSASREDVIFAAGDQGLILRYDGREESAWHREGADITTNLYGVWAGAVSPKARRLDDAPFEAWVVGANGFVAHRSDSGQWSSTPSGTESTLRSVSGTGAEMITAVGDQGAIIGWDGTRWRPEQSPTEHGLRGISVAPNGVAVAVGDHGTLLVRQKGEWRPHQSPTTAHLHGVSQHAGQAVVVGDGGIILEWKKKAWTRTKSPVQESLLSVSSDGRDTWYAVGQDGAILTRNAPTTPWTVSKTVPSTSGLRSVVGLHYSAARTYAHDTRFVYRSAAPLPEVPDRLEAVANIKPALDADRRQGTSPREWNVPLRGFETPILMGLLTYEPSKTKQGMPTERVYNTAILLDSDGRRLGLYDKNYLLIFGEYLPFGEEFPVLYDWIPEANRFERGRTTETFPFMGFQLGVMICYEDILPAFGRALAGKEPNVFINVTNDAWFGKTSEPYLHMALSVFRSVEHRRWLLRSTNTGVSCFIDAVGRIRSQTSMDDPELLVADVPMMTGSTFYGTYGELFTVICFLLMLLMIIRALMDKTPPAPQTSARTTEPSDA
jgi:apolipoprotein N-acyltransferase